MRTKLAAEIDLASNRKSNAAQGQPNRRVAKTEVMRSLPYAAVMPRDAAPPYFAAHALANAYILSWRKRALDVVVASVALLVLLPALLMLALAVKISSSGPVIFRQARNGLDCRHFSILKFRTMYDAPEEGEGFLKQACRGDSRVTPLGYWLRRLSLDELPQIVNVLRGDMSLVGPRPHALSHDIHYAALIPSYYDRYCCRPGVTGLAQVSGARGETASHDDMRRRVDWDLRYLETASLMLDVKIIVKTAVKLFDNRGVY